MHSHNHFLTHGQGRSFARTRRPNMGHVTYRQKPVTCLSVSAGAPTARPIGQTQQSEARFRGRGTVLSDVANRRPLPSSGSHAGRRGSGDGPRTAAEMPACDGRRWGHRLQRVRSFPGVPGGGGTGAGECCQLRQGQPTCRRRRLAHCDGRAPQWAVLSKSRISARSLSCADGSEGGAGFASSLRRAMLTPLINRKMAKATMTKSRTVLMKTP